jgi:hypothetical protein
MTKECQMTNDETPRRQLAAPGLECASGCICHSGFVIPSSFGIRHSSLPAFVIRHSSFVIAWRHPSFVLRH